MIRTTALENCDKDHNDEPQDANYTQHEARTAKWRGRKNSPVEA